MSWAAAGLALAVGQAPAQGTSLRFFGGGVNAPDADRVKIRIDDPANSLPGPPADVGAEDFTLEFWMKAAAADNDAPPISCGDNINWIFGNIVFDRDRFNQDRKYGLSLGAGRWAFGVSGDGTGARTICGTSNVLDLEWHHVAVQRRRSDGRMWLFVDGVLEAQADGPDGDVSYPDDGVPGNHCGGPCTNSDPFLVIAAEKHDAGAQYPSYNGWIDEVRLSSTLRYTSSFPPPTSPFVADPDTAALYHFDEGGGSIVFDTSQAQGGPSDGVVHYGGTPTGPVWSNDTPFAPCPVVGYCTAKTNSCGGLPEVTWSGVPSATASAGFEVSAANARGAKSGLLLYTDAGRATPAVPFQGGWLCLDPPLRRTPVVPAGGTPGQCDGVLRIDMNAFASGGLGGNPQPFLRIPGTQVQGQWWGRDTVAAGSLLSDALDYAVCP